MIEAPLLLRLQDFEKRHDEIMSYAFDVFTSMQKQYFAEMSVVFSGYRAAVPPDSTPSLPLIVNHGSRQDIDEVKAAIMKQNQMEKDREREKAQPSKPVTVTTVPVEQPMHNMSAYDPSTQQSTQPMYSGSAYSQQPAQPYDMSAYQQSVFPQVPTQSADMATYQQPTEMPVYQQPTTMPTYQQPVEMPVYQQPTEMPVYQQPAEMPVYQQPAVQPYDMSSYPQVPTQPPSINAEETVQAPAVSQKPVVVSHEPIAEQLVNDLPYWS